MLGVVVPAHNEEDHLGTCLESLWLASRCRHLGGEPVLVVVVLDDCNDRSADIARQWQATVVPIAARNVGVARACGARRALEAGARWLAFTDADSVVAPDWLSAQLDQASDVVCGTVQVRDWGAYGAPMQRHWDATYFDREDHRHIHGANLGVCAMAYDRVGGFPPLACSEDVALVHALRDQGARIAWSNKPRVTTSARSHFRAPGGFGETLARVAADFPVRHNSAVTPGAVVVLAPLSAQRSVRVPSGSEAPIATLLIGAKNEVRRTRSRTRHGQVLDD